MNEHNPMGPSAGHEPLEQVVGTWNAVATFYFGPEPTSSQGKMVSRWILGGRFIEQDYSGEAFGEIFEGRGYFGFNNGSGLYEGIWMDVASTCIAIDKGSYDAETRTWEMIGTFDNPVSGEPSTKRSTIKILSDDEHLMESYHPDLEGEDRLAMTIRFTRAAD